MGSGRGVGLRAQPGRDAEAGRLRPGGGQPAPGTPYASKERPAGPPWTRRLARPGGPVPRGLGAGGAAGRGFQRGLASLGEPPGAAPPRPAPGIQARQPLPPEFPVPASPHPRPAPLRLRPGRPAPHAECPARSRGIARPARLPGSPAGGGARGTQPTRWAWAGEAALVLLQVGASGSARRRKCCWHPGRGAHASPRGGLGADGPVRLPPPSVVVLRASWECPAEGNSWLITFSFLKKCFYRFQHGWERETERETSVMRESWVGCLLHAPWGIHMNPDLPVHRSAIAATPAGQ